MNRYPLWKYAVMLVALVIGLVYTLPNFFGEAPAVQVSSGKATVKLDSTTLANIENALAADKVTPDEVTFDNSSTERQHPRAPERHRHAIAREGPVAENAQQRPERSAIRRRAESAERLAALADRVARAAHVPRPRLARRRPLPAASGHGGRAEQEARLERRGRPRAVTRQKHPRWRRESRESVGRGEFRRSGRSRRRAHAC